MKVKDIMTQSVKSCGEDASLEKVAVLMEKNNCGAVPVVDSENKLKGIVTDRDVCMAAAKKKRMLSEIKAGEAMHHPAHTCSVSDSMDMAMTIMRTQKIYRVPVVDNRGELKGIVSMHDIILNYNDKVKEKDADISARDIVLTLKASGTHHQKYEFETLMADEHENYSQRTSEEVIGL